MQNFLPPKTYLFTVSVIALSYFVLATVSTTLPVMIGGVSLAIAGLAATIIYPQLLSAVNHKRTVGDLADKTFAQGFFQYSHDPMYLGFALSNLGWAIAFSSPFGWVALGVFVFIALPAVYPL